jgi:hypothetical protein
MRLLIPSFLLSAAVSVAGASDVVPKPVTASTDPKPKAEETVPTWERYKVLSQRNMFSKNRGRSQEESRRERERERERTRETPAAPREESSIVLIGVVQKDGVPAAILENRSSGKIQTLAKGAMIGAGTIKTISLDSLDFDCDGILHVIKVGQTLAGTAPSSAPAASTVTTTAPAGTASTTTGPTATAPTTSAGSPASGPAAAPSGGGDSVLEQMRRRRQEEMRK